MSQVRYTRLLEIVHTKGYASIELLAEELGCSQPTIRRDIKKLCEANLLQRFHGGVSQIESSVRLGYESKSGLMQHEKRAIARHVLTHLRSCGDFFLDTGTTCDQVASALSALSGKQIITHNLSAALILASQENDHSIVVAGGVIRGADGSLTGAKTCHDIQSYHADCAVISASGLDSFGNVLDFDSEKVAVKQAMMNASGRKILLLDSSKFHKRGAVKVARLCDFDLCITNAPPTDTYIELFATSATPLEIADCDAL